MRSLLAGLALTTAAALLGAGVALAAMSSLSPSSGTVSPGGSASTSFTVTPPSLPLGLPGTSCVVAGVSPNPAQFAVSFDGLGLETLPNNCVLGATAVVMRVSASPTAPPGTYVVTIREVEVGGQLITSRTWPLIVVAPPTTTTTSTTTTTIAVPVITVPLPGSTSSTSTTSASTQPPVATTDTTATSANTESSSTPSTASEGTADNPDDEEGSGVIAAPGDGNGPDYPSGGGGTGSMAERSRSIDVSAALRDRMSNAVPAPLASLVLSPIVIGEILLRSMMGSAAGFLIPLVITSMVGLWLIMRMRREVDEDELERARQAGV